MMVKLRADVMACASAFIPKRECVLASRSAIGLVMFMLAACAAGTPGMGAAAGTSNADVTRDARLLRMTDLRQLDTTLIDELLADGNAACRARATLAIGQVKGKARYPQLRRLLVDADTAVAANAAFALGLAKDSSAIVALARAVAGAPDPVAVAAAWSLGDIGEAARSVLLLALGDGIGLPLVNSTAAQRSPAVRAALVTAFAKLRAAPAAVIVPWLDDADPVVVRSTAYVLARTRAAAGVRPMLALRASADEETRQHVARILLKSAVHDSLTSRALETLNALFADTSARVRANVVRSLASYGPTAREPVLRGTRDPDGNVRIATSEVVGPLLGTDADAWKSAWNRDSTLQVRINLLGAARRAGTNALHASEDVWIKAGDWRSRAAVLRARVDTMHPPKLADVSWGLTDADARVREAAVAATRAVVRADASQADSTRVLWNKLLLDTDVQVRAAVIGLLRPNANAAELPLVLDAYSRSLNEPDNDARVAALSYIVAAWNRDSAKIQPALRSRVSTIAAPSDSSERAIGQTIAPLATWRGVRNAATAKPLADYELLVRKYVINGARPVTAVIHTVRGDISLALFGREAPFAVDNFVQLSRKGYYRDTQFHRVVPNFVAQAGDPRGDGSGGPGYSLRDELTRFVHTRGCLAMARSGPDTGGSQYYLCHSPQPHLDGAYTVFGHMTKGYEVLDRIVQGDRILNIEIR